MKNIIIGHSALRLIKFLLLQSLFILLLPKSGWGQCTNDCQIDLGSSDPYVSFSGDITNDVTGNEMTSQSVDILDGSTTCGLATDGSNDFTFNFTTEEYFDVYGGNTIATGAGSSTRDIKQSSSGLSGNNVAGTNSSTTNTSTGDVSCYSIEVIYAIAQQAQDVDIELSSINTKGESFESSSVIFYDATGSPYGSAGYNGFWNGVPQGSGTGTNSTNVNVEANIYTVSGSGVFVAADPIAVDIANPMTPVAGADGPNNSTTISADGTYSVGGINAGLNPSDLVGGFIFRVCLEDVATTSSADESTTTSTAFTSTLNSFTTCLDTCPDGVASFTAPPVVVSSESTCEADGITLSGGIIAVPATSCPTGSTIEYSLDGFATAGTVTVPPYNQTTATTVSTRCICYIDSDVISMVGSVTTVPGTCPPPEVCRLPELDAFATCTDDATGDEAAQDEYYIQIDITSLGSDTDSDNEVTVTVGGTSVTYTAIGSYFLGPFTHSGAGTITNSITYGNDGEDCTGDITISETLCGYSTDSDGTSDDTADDDLHASGPACDCDEDMPGSVLAQVEPGSYDPVTSVMVYILVDGAGNIVTSNNTGLFTGLADDTYTVYPYNVDLTEVASFVPVVGSDYADFMPDNGTCNFGCGSAVMTLACDCRIDDVALRKVLSSSGPFMVGDKVAFAITVYNQGTHPIYNVDVDDYLPSTLDFFAADNVGNDFVGNPDTAGGGTVSASIASTTPIAPGSSHSLTIVLTINSSATMGSDIVNDAEVTGATEDAEGNRSIADEDDSLADMGGGTNEDDDNIEDDSIGGTDALTDQDDFDMALLSLCNGLNASVDSPTVCKNQTSAPINLNVTEGTVQHIQLFYDPAASAAGFVDFVPLLTPFPTEYVIPAGLTDGVYNGVIIIWNADMCNTSIPFTITVECPDCGTFPWDGSK